MMVDIDLPPDDENLLREYAARIGRDVAWVVREALEIPIEAQSFLNQVAQMRERKATAAEGETSTPKSTLQAGQPAPQEKIVEQKEAAERLANLGGSDPSLADVRRRRSD